MTVSLTCTIKASRNAVRALQAIIYRNWADALHGDTSQRVAQQRCPPCAAPRAPPPSLTQSLYWPRPSKAVYTSAHATIINDTKALSAVPEQMSLTNCQANRVAPHSRPCKVMACNIPHNARTVATLFASCFQDASARMLLKHHNTYLGTNTATCHCSHR